MLTASQASPCTTHYAQLKLYAVHQEQAISRTAVVKKRTKRKNNRLRLTSNLGRLDAPIKGEHRISEN
jgi:hypothetical protein